MSEVLEKLKKRDINIPKRTFEYYQRLGFLPKPKKQVGKGGRGVYGYYNPEVANMVKKIIGLKDQSFTLEEIIKKLKSDL